jgi:hypothetical protein
MKILHILIVEDEIMVAMTLEMMVRTNKQMPRCRSASSLPRKRIMGRSLLSQRPRRALRLALCINVVLLLGGCGVNYRFCPAGTEKDPSRPFTTCKTTTP